MNDLNVEQLLVQANPVLDTEELRLTSSEVDARCASIPERRGVMQTQIPTRTPAGAPAPRRWSKPTLAFMISLFVILIAVGGVALLVGGGDPEVADEPTPTTQTTSTTTTTTTSPTSTSAPATSTTTATTKATTESLLVPPTPFAPLEIYPPEGLSLKVVGVAHDGALNVRQGPGLTPIVTTLGSMDWVESKGEGREFQTTTWWKVDDEADTLIEGRIGWVNSSYLASSGSARVDLTSHVVGEYGGSPAAATMADLGQLVAETLVSKDYPSRVAMIVAPTAGNPGYATFDVVSEDPLGLRVALRGANGQNIWRFSVKSTLDNGSFRLESVEGQAFIHACACWLP